MEKDFLIYILYITLVEIREHSMEQNDKRIFWLCDLLHNIPFALKSEEETQAAYRTLLTDVKELGVDQWLEARKGEFLSRFPEYNR